MHMLLTCSSVARDLKIDADDVYRTGKLTDVCACSEAALTTGYSPFLSLRVDDLQETIQRIIPMGAEMDGPIQFAKNGRVVAVRNPDGHMMTLFEQS